MEIRCFKHLSSVTLMFLTDLLVAKVLASAGGDGPVNLDDDRGFSQLYKWQNLQDGFVEAKRSGRPMMIVIHEPWCSACQRLKLKFAKSMKLIDLSRQFVMVNMENGNAHGTSEASKFQPDGKYVPRVLFLSPNGDLIEEVYNRHLTSDFNYRHFYASPAEIIDSMNSVMSIYPPRSPQSADPDQQLDT